MKIIYLTDIHDSLRNLKEVVMQTSADLFLFSGDIIYKAFFSTEKIISFCTIQDDLYRIASDNGEEINPYDLATRILRFPKKYTESNIQTASSYRDLFHQASKTMKEKYQLLHDMVKAYAKSPVLFLPGNYDIDLQYTALYEMDLHRKSFSFHGIKFSGYGGAPIITSGIPEKLSVKFHEYNQNGDLSSEPEDFFRYENPDIVVIHNPAYGFLDKIPSLGHIGSHGIRRYLDDNCPALVVSGHVHEDQGIIKYKDTVYLNPSNFGSVDSIHGIQGGGYYTEIYLQDKKVSQVNLLHLQNKKIEKLLELDCTQPAIRTIYENSLSPVSADQFVRQL